MEFGGRYIIAAPRQSVWAALNDPEILKASIPGCKKIAWRDAESLDIEVGVNLGIAKPSFSGELILSDVDPAQSYVLSGRGKGGIFGLAHASARITLEDAEGGTLLAFAATGGASGRIMQLGRALIGNSAQAIIDGFFERFAGAMGADVTLLPPAA